MKNLRRGMLGLWIGMMSIPASADIVWEGKRVDAWPAKALQPNRSSAAIAGRATATANHYPSPKGKVYGLTLLVDFSDAPAKFTQQEISDWLNKPGFDRDGCDGSVRDYYLDLSKGMVDFTNEVFGWYRAKHTKAYYEGLPGYSGSDELLNELIEHFDLLVDFSRYDNDKDGTTEAISIVYSGAGLTWGQGLWPHAGWVGMTRDGTALDRYQMTDMPGQFSLYVFVHECGHMLFGWPDLYWYGDYCSMANRADDLNPVAINDFFRADQGWIPFVDVTALDTGTASSTDGERVWRYRNPDRPDTEGFAWSYLHNTGRRSVIRGSGLFVQHYDFSIDGNSSASSLGLRPVQADGLEELQAEQWPTKSNDPKDLFQAATVGQFDDLRFPLLRWYSGKTSGISVSGIGTPSATLAFQMGPPLPTASLTAHQEAEKAQVVSGTIKSSTAASAGSYVTSLDGQSSKVVFTINRAQVGPCTLTVRYANGGTRNASHVLSVNGGADSLVYRPTGAWARFDSVAKRVELRQGRNQIVLGKKTDIVELDAISLGAATPAVGIDGDKTGKGVLRRSGNGRIEAPASMAGTRLEFLDLAGRTVGRTILVLSGDRAVGTLPEGPSRMLVWRFSSGQGIRAVGGLLEP